MASGVEGQMGSFLAEYRDACGFKQFNDAGVSSLVGSCERRVIGFALDAEVG